MAAFRWARDTLAQNILGSMNNDRNTPGGTVPDRLANIVLRAYYTIWEAHDWKFKDILATLTFASATNTVDLPAKFDKLSQKWLKENNRHGSVRFTEDAQLFESQRRLPGDPQGQPYVVRIEPKTGEATFLWQARCIPTPNKEYTYQYIYKQNAPDLAADTTFPIWPDKFDRGWEKIATAQATRMMVRNDSWKALWAEYRGWLDTAIEQDDETMVSSTPHIQDTQGDVANLPSNMAGYGFGGFSGR